MGLPPVTATLVGNPFVAPGGPRAPEVIVTTGRGAPPPPSIEVSTTIQQAAAAQGGIPAIGEFLEALEAPADTLCATLCPVAEVDLDHALASVLVDGCVLGAIPRAKLVGFLRSMFFAF